MPRSDAIEGICAQAWRAAWSSSFVGAGGNPFGLIILRAGQRIAAWRISCQRSGSRSASSTLLVTSASRSASSAGKRAPGSGGRAERVSASGTSSSAKARSILSSQRFRAPSTCVLSASLRPAASMRDGSSRVSALAPATMERRSRSGTSRRFLDAASALSSHSAALTRGRSSSASEMTPDGSATGSPAAFAASLRWSSARLTAGIPPRRSCSATLR